MIEERLYQFKLRIVRNIKKCAGKVYGFDIVICDDPENKEYIKGFEAGKKFMLDEVLKNIDKSI